MLALRGVLVPIAVLFAAALGAIVRPEFFDVPSLLLTLGGALAVTCFSYSPTHLRDLTRAIEALFSRRPESLKEHLEQLLRLTHLFRLKGLRGLEGQERHLTDPFLRQGVGMLIDLQRKEIIQTRLERELAEVLSCQEISRQILITLGKLLPSFGLIGTLTGLVLLLKNVSDQNVSALPAALSLAVLTTLYGAVLANVVVAPLAARLHAAAVENEAKMRLTFDWIMAVLSGETAAKTSIRLTELSRVAERLPRRARSWPKLASKLALSR
jgi:chemotaxis protein MotA